MIKYPVISKNGNKYEVEMFFGKTIAYAGFNVIISKKGRGLFGRDKFITLREYNEFHNDMSNRRETLSEYSWVELAKMYVAKYEEENAEDIAFERRLSEIGKEFEEWDGYC